MLKYSVQIACIHFNVCPSNIYYNYKLHLPHSKSQFEFVQVVVKSYTSFILDGSTSKGSNQTVWCWFLFHDNAIFNYLNWTS